jgi:hypothetical protein
MAQWALDENEARRCAGASAKQSARRKCRTEHSAYVRDRLKRSSARLRTRNNFTPPQLHFFLSCRFGTRYRQEALVRFIDASQVYITSSGKVRESEVRWQNLYMCQWPLASHQASHDVRPHNDRIQLVPKATHTSHWCPFGMRVFDSSVYKLRVIQKIKTSPMDPIGDIISLYVGWRNLLLEEHCTRINSRYGIAGSYCNLNLRA